MYTEALSQIQKDDDPEINQDYYVDVKKIANILGQDPRGLRSISQTAAKTLLNAMPTVYFESEQGWTTCYIFDSISSVPNKWYLYQVRFSDKMRRILINMRKKFEIIYPSATIIHFKNKYTHLLYDFLLAQMTRMTPDGAYFHIKVTPEEIIHKLKYPYKGHMGAFNRDVITPASRDINEFSEIFIKDGLPVIERSGRTVVSYTFIVMYKPDREIPLVPYDDTDETQRLYTLSDVPTNEFLEETMQAMGVAESFIKYVMKQDQPMRCWRNILYTKIHYGNAPRLFNQAYSKDYARKYDIQDLIMEARKLDPNFKDPITLVSIMQPRSQQSKDVVSKIYKKEKISEEVSLFDEDANEELTHEQKEIRAIVSRVLKNKETNNMP
jgi:hypothetical protein